MTYIREHELAQTHSLTQAALKKADRAVSAARKKMLRKAEKLRAKAEEMLSEASELSYTANKNREYDTPFATLREKIEDEGYWLARAEIGTLPRDDAGNYIDPAPYWKVTYNGEHVGTYQGEETSDVLRIVCPKDDGRSWGDFELEKVVI